MYDHSIDMISINNLNNILLHLPAEVQTYIANIIAERVRMAAAPGKTQQELAQALNNYKAYYQTHGQCRRAMLGTRLAQIYPYSEKNVPTPLQIIVQDKRYALKYLKNNVKRFSANEDYNKKIMDENYGYGTEQLSDDLNYFVSSVLNELLLENGADLNCMSRDGIYKGTLPLNKALRYHSKEMVAWLLRHGADPDGVECGITPLGEGVLIRSELRSLMNSKEVHIAFRAWKENNKSEECMRLLHAAGANPFKIILLHPEHSTWHPVHDNSLALECNGKSAAQLAIAGGDLRGLPKFSDQSP